MKLFPGTICATRISLAICSTLTGVAGLFASTATFETTGLIPVAGGDEIGETFDYYVTTFDESAFSSNNDRQYVIFDSMSQLTYDENDEDDDDDDTRIYYSVYHGYNPATGEEQDQGRLIMECSVDEVYMGGSNIAGFLRTSGPWVATGDVVDKTIAEGSGTITYTNLKKTRDVDLVFNAQLDGASYRLFGESTASVTSEDSVTVSSWSADTDSDYEFSLSAVYFARDEDIWYQYLGWMSRTDTEDPDDWKTRYALVRLIDTNDADGDEIPNFSDLGAEDVYGVLTSNSISVSEDQIWSNDLNTYVYYDPQELWLYGENLGWFYLPDQEDSEQIRIYIPSDSLGWLWTNEEMSPLYVRELDGVKVYFARIDDAVWYYDYSTESWNEITY